MILDRVEDFQGAAHWASYLVNGDGSGVSDRECQLADRWLAGIQGDAPAVSVVDVGEPYFSWSYGLYTGDKSDGGMLADYKILIYREAAP